MLNGAFEAFTCTAKIGRLITECWMRSGADSAFFGREGDQSCIVVHNGNIYGQLLTPLCNVYGSNNNIVCIFVDSIYLCQMHVISRQLLNLIMMSSAVISMFPNAKDSIDLG
jgi:hypothetical protein